MTNADDAASDPATPPVDSTPSPINTSTGENGGASTQADCAGMASILRELVATIQDLKVTLKSCTPPPASPPRADPRPRALPDPSPDNHHPTPSPTICVYQPGLGRPADEMAASMSQLNTLLLGSAPAFAQAMRLQTDAIATGLGALNAVSNQHSQNNLALASVARGFVETTDRGPAPK